MGLLVRTRDHPGFSDYIRVYLSAIVCILLQLKTADTCFNPSTPPISMFSNHPSDYSELCPVIWCVGQSRTRGLILPKPIIL